MKKKATLRRRAERAEKALATIIAAMLPAAPDGVYAALESLGLDGLYHDALYHVAISSDDVAAALAAPARREAASRFILDEAAQWTPDDWALLARTLAGVGPALARRVNDAIIIMNGSLGLTGEAAARLRPGDVADERPSNEEPT